MISYADVICSKCKLDFTITLVCNEMVGNYYCPACGQKYEKGNN